MATQHKKILVIKLGALGDFFQALGPMAAIRTHHKNAHISLLTTKPFEKFAKECGYFDEIIIDPKPKWHQFIKISKLKKILNQGFDRIYDLQNNDRTSFYFGLLKSPKPEWSGVAKGASHRNTAPTRTAGHAYTGHKQTLKLAGIENIEVDTLDWMKGDISKLDLKEPYVLIVPGCAPQHPYKRWSPEKYGKIANFLTEKNIQPVILGAKAEEEITKQIQEICPTAYNLVSKTNLHQIVELARGAKGAIGNDTGPMHMIGPTGCKTLIVFSRHSNPIRHKALGANVETLQSDDLSQLGVDTVQKTLHDLLEL